VNRPDRSPRDPGRDARRDLIRKVDFYTFIFLGAALLITLVGSALIAWLLRGLGGPFLYRWLIIAAIILLPPVMAMIWREIRGKAPRDTEDRE
jgi:hypothetical protein